MSNSIWKPDYLEGEEYYARIRHELHEAAHIFAVKKNHAIHDDNLNKNLINSYLIARTEIEPDPFISNVSANVVISGLGSVVIPGYRSMVPGATAFIKLYPAPDKRIHSLTVNGVTLYGTSGLYRFIVPGDDFIVSVIFSTAYSGYSSEWSEEFCVHVNVEYDSAWMHRVCVVTEFLFASRWSSKICVSIETSFSGEWSNAICVEVEEAYKGTWDADSDVCVEVSNVYYESTWNDGICVIISRAYSSVWSSDLCVTEEILYSGKWDVDSVCVVIPTEYSSVWKIKICTTI